jgi:hypothetical protein
MNYGGMDSLVVAGKSLYGSGESEMNPNMAQVRAITDGTGRHIGARGQVATAHQSADVYLYLIELVDW